MQIPTTLCFSYFRTSFSDFGSIILFSLVYSGIQLFGGFFAVLLYIFLKWKGKCKSLIPEETTSSTYEDEVEEREREPSANLCVDEQPRNQSKEIKEEMAHINPAFETSNQKCNSRI